MAKKKKTGGSSKRRMKAVLSARGGQMKPPQRTNPFETILPRSKFDCLGKKNKGEERRLGHSRSLALQKREKTLKPEFERRNKSSQFDDNRIGEKDPSLLDFDKAVLRQQKERLSKLKRKSKFNISDDEDEETEKDDFEEVLPPDEDGIEDFINLDTKNRSMDFNHSEGNEKPYKTKKQVMSEIIEKSKFFKAEKAKEKEEDEQLMEKLDEKFNSFSQNEALNVLLSTSKTGHEKSNGSKQEFSLTKEKPDAYDKLVKEMVMESRARPSDRVKTPEEIAREERERLEELEEERQKRMLAPDDDDDDDSSEEEENSDNDDQNNNTTNKISKKLQITSGDDLGDSFLLDDDNNQEDQENQEDSEEDESDSEEDENSDKSDSEELEKIAKNWEQSDDEEPILDQKTDNLKEKKEKKKEVKNKENESNELGQLPFVIEAPNNLKELCELLDDRSESEIIEVIKRIRTCNNTKLGTDNRKKMQIFYGLLLQYFATISSRIPLKYNILNALIKPLIEMSSETPYFSAICAKQRLERIRLKFCQDLKSPEKDSWPNMKCISLFRLWLLTFPSSDFRHVVTSPLLLLISEFLMRCRVLSGRDLGIGSFLCFLLLSAIKQSKKYCPEAIRFIQTILLSSINLKQIQLPSQLSELVEQREIKPWLYINNQNCEIQKINLISLFENQKDSSYFSSDEFKGSILLSASEALMGFIQVYEDLNSFPEIFNLSVLLREILEKNELPDILRTNLQNCEDFIKRKIIECSNMRVPLQMNKKKVESIKLMNPKFEENFVKGVDYDPDREKVQQKRLKRKIKSEVKGAIRELRKDKDFIENVKEEKRREKEVERVEKYGKDLAFLQDQERAFKSGQLGKGRKKRK